MGLLACSRALGDAVAEQGKEGSAGGRGGARVEDAGDGGDAGAEAVGATGEVAGGAGLAALGLQAGAERRNSEGVADETAALAGGAEAFAAEAFAAAFEVAWCKCAGHNAGSARAVVGPNQRTSKQRSDMKQTVQAETGASP